MGSSLTINILCLCLRVQLQNWSGPVKVRIVNVKCGNCYIKASSVAPFKMITLFCLDSLVHNGTATVYVTSIHTTLHETYDHWSVPVSTVTVHSSFVPTFDFFFKKYDAFCTGFNLLTLIFMLPYIIMDVPIFLMHRKFRLLLSLCVIHEPSQMREVRR